MHIEASQTTRRRHDEHLFAVALPIVMAAALAWWHTSLSAQATKRSSSLETTVDASIHPGDDFFAYANGAWLKANTIPAGKQRWGARDELEGLARGRVAALLDAASSAPAGSAARKVADFRAAYMNEAAIEARGLAPLKPQFDRIENISDKAQLTRILGRGMRADVDPEGFGVYDSASVLGLSVEQSIHGEKNNVAFLLQGGLGLDRDDYLGADSAKRDRYRQSIAKTLTLAGFDRGDERASAVLALETAIAQSHTTSEESSKDHNADNVWTRADFAQRAPGMDWTSFFDAADLGKQPDLVVWQPAAVTGLAALVASQPLEVWKDYLRFHVILDYADVLPRAFAEEALAANGKQSTRAERALAATQSAMSDAIGRMYAERYFPAAQKARLERISD
ncbi:MAG TPA: M13 family metallopeptidase N-terminal domain-containing protein, partial [Thermoanaerobaculia bacterium]|nr:M13 family metallopeptidase N-terminal domain-containing protein [Thermoanaerobaculia bacterium]